MKAGSKSSAEVTVNRKPDFSDSSMVVQSLSRTARVSVDPRTALPFRSKH